MDRKSLKFKLIIFTATIIIVMSILNIYTILGTVSIENQYRDVIDKLVTVDDINENMNLSMFYFDDYFITRSKEDLDNFRKYYTEAQKDVDSLKPSFQGNVKVYLLDLQNVLNSYKESGENTVFDFRSSYSSEKPSEYQETKTIQSYCNVYIKQIQEEYLKYSSQTYKNLVLRNKVSRYVTLVTLLFITLACIFFTIIFSRQITVPIKKLVKSSEKVSKGDFTIAKVPFSGVTEIDILADGFNVMVDDINTLVQEIKLKADVEKKLKDQEMENLIYQNMLKEAKLKMLQSQVNPHFLFNTLNAIVQTSIIENAPNTERLINSVSEMLRYSLSMVDKLSTVGKEVDIIKRYIYIQETRFKDRIKFILNVDETLNEIILPGMILQPLVENAFIHGIEGKEEGGNILIDVYRKDQKCIIKIEDDGVGMTEAKLNEVMNMESEKHVGHSTNIGVKNVVKRLKLFYDKENVFSIESTINKGTTIYIKLPIYEEEEYA